MKTGTDLHSALHVPFPTHLHPILDSAGTPRSPVALAKLRTLTERVSGLVVVLAAIWVGKIECGHAFSLWLTLPRRLPIALSHISYIFQCKSWVAL